MIDLDLIDYFKHATNKENIPNVPYPSKNLTKTKDNFLKILQPST